MSLLAKYSTWMEMPRIVRAIKLLKCEYNTLKRLLESKQIAPESKCLSSRPVDQRKESPRHLGTLCCILAGINYSALLHQILIQHYYVFFYWTVFGWVAYLNLVLFVCLSTAKYVKLKYRVRIKFFHIPWRVTTSFNLENFTWNYICYHSPTYPTFFINFH